MSALTDGIISSKMFKFEIYIESYAHTLGQYFHSQYKDRHWILKIMVLEFFLFLDLSLLLFGLPSFNGDSLGEMRFFCHEEITKLSPEICVGEAIV